MSPIMEITTVVLVDVNSPANVIIVVRLGTISMSVIQRKVAIDIEKWQENDQVELVFDFTSWIGFEHVCTIDGKLLFAFIKNTWIGDTGASCDTTDNDDSIFDAKTINGTVHGSLRTMKAKKLGKKKVQTKWVDGTQKNIIHFKSCNQSWSTFLVTTYIHS